MSEILDKNIIKALDSDARQEIVKMLSKRPYTASELAKMMHKHVTTVTEHLMVLEKSGLVKKKDSTNKWVYYALSDRGERLFKPQFYSWVIVFCLSAVFMFVGFLRLVQFEGFSGAERSALGIAQSDPPLAATEAIAVSTVDYVAIALIVIGVIGLAYLAYKKYSRR